MQITRPRLEIPAVDLQKAIQDFTLSDRYWTAYSADKLETMLRHYHVLPAGFYYSRFDSENETAIFLGPIDFFQTEKQLRSECKMLPPTAKLLKA